MPQLLRTGGTGGIQRRIRAATGRYIRVPDQDHNRPRLFHPFPGSHDASSLQQLTVVNDGEDPM
ncbi:hypothetical protein NicSoilB8_20470 [Arthrobacter sp. NicSoilB8]|nr:hypothetical protein NicSoilB8_20470 [Arthrobacter sp. NicSoilB8]